VTKFRIVICRGPECGDRRGSAVLHAAFRDALDRHAVEGTECDWQSCFGRCTQGPNVLVRELLEPLPPGAPAPPRKTLGSGFATLPHRVGLTALYNRIDLARVERIVVDHVKAGQIVRDFIERPGIHPLDPVASRTKPQ
jgi:(2Fe-2S) ferredoxin